MKGDLFRVNKATTLGEAAELLVQKNVGTQTKGLVYSEVRHSACAIVISPSSTTPLEYISMARSLACMEPVK
jgi:hypothetical protein